MAKPVAGYVQLPDDSGNTGKKQRTQTRVVGSDTVHEHFIVPIRQAAVNGVWQIALAQQTVLASAQNGTSTGFLWMVMPTGASNVSFRLRRVWVASQHATALATPTAPRLAMSRITFSGTASGAAVTPGKIDSTFGSPSCTLRTAVTGLTPSLVAVLAVAPIIGALTAVGGQSSPAAVELVAPDEDNWPVFAPGEGIVLWQDVNGTSSDTRVLEINILFDEIDTA